MGDAALADELFGSPSAAILLQGLPVRNAAHFSVCKIVGSHRFQVDQAATYVPTHDRTLPPADQVIRTEKTNILLRRFHQLAEDQACSQPKRTLT